MLRFLIALLLLANVAFYCWSEGWLDSMVGIRSIGDREPERLGHQVNPELVRILGNETSARASAPSPTLVCLEAGPFNDAQAVAAQAGVQDQLPSGSWALVRIDKPGSWIVYMGKYPNHESLVKKEDELKRLKLDFEEFHGNANLEPGLSFGRFDDRSAATGKLDQLVQQGVRTARIVELSQPTSSQMLRVEKADPGLAARLAALQTSALGNGFTPCAKPEGG
jgi:hypothetical protein